MKYKVHSLFPTIQGEGRWTGHPVTLLRLSGCNLKCAFCDTKDALGLHRHSWSLEYLVSRVTRVHRHGNAILITGGEPTLQPLGPLAEALHGLGPLHLETNGTLPFESAVERFEWITVSPKPAQQMPSREVLKDIDEIKWLVESVIDVFALQKFLVEHRSLNHWHISMQPISCDQHATDVAVRACIHYGWQLSIQVHKYIGADNVYGGDK